MNLAYTSNKENKYKIQDVTIQVTGDCNLACTYCYQHDKNHQKVDIKKAKKFIDKIVENDQSFWKGYIDFGDKYSGIALQFIGGEPFMNYEAIIELTDYFNEQCKKYNRIEFFNRSVIGICSNGTIYNKEIEEYLKKYKGKVTVSITVDGNKELHDTCRRYKNSDKPSYDIVIENLKKFRELVCPNKPVQSKITVSPQNLPYLYDAVVNMFENLKYDVVPANCVYEDVWQIKDAQLLYKQLKKIADWMLEKDYIMQDMDFAQEKKVTGKQFGFFSDLMFCKECDFNTCWCGGNGQMLFMQYDGKIYNCSRYAETSVGNPEKDLVLGTVDDGMVYTDNINLLKSQNRRSMYDDECKVCPIARGCAECVAFAYEFYGEFKHLKTLCDMHKARSLANVYFWNNYYIKHDMDNVFLMNLPVGEAQKYVDKREIEMLLDLSNRRFINKIKEN